MTKSEYIDVKILRSVFQNEVISDHQRVRDECRELRLYVVGLEEALREVVGALEGEGLDGDRFLDVIKSKENS